jgi:hypothetical protein
MADKLRGYILPENVADYDESEFVCVKLLIPNDSLYRAALLAQLHELGNWHAWEHRPGARQDDIAEQAAQFWRDTALDNITITDAPCGDGDDDETDDAPYWAEADAASDTGAGNNWEYIGDWAITAFLATAGSPGAALLYRTLVSKARLAFKTQDAGDIADIFIDGILALSIATASAVPGVPEIIEANIDLVQFAIDHSLPAGVERVIEIVARAA